MASYAYERLPPTDSATVSEEEQSLLPTSRQDASHPISEKPSRLGLLNFCRECASDARTKDRSSSSRIVGAALGIGFAGGVVSVLLLRWLFPSTTACYSFNDQQPPSSYRPFTNPSLQAIDFSFPGDIGATEAHKYPPTSPTNNIPDLFPTQIGFAGPTVTGAEPGLALTAPSYPSWKGTDGLLHPKLWDGKNADGVQEELVEETPWWIEDDTLTTNGKHKKKFDIFQHWGNLSPFYSVPADSFGIESSTGAEIPPTCELKGVHILHRHGARYPTGRFDYAAPPGLAYRLNQAANSTNLRASGPLSFLNTWTYKLGTEVLTPFGRQQLFDLGVSMRMKYGNLLEGFKDRLPVIRTESQDRMLASATNFALGFFGWPLEDKLLMSVTVEADYYNNTLAPYKSCPNDWKPDIGERGNWYVREWVHIYLSKAKERIQSLLEGYELTYEDIYSMQMLCVYETVALGYSGFCGLFTQAEWEGFEYALDLYFWYDSGFGSPVARAMGSGYVLELLSRLTGTPIHHPSSLISTPSTFSVNLTLDSNPTTFPLDHPLYVDATHEVVIVNILTALNLTILSEDGPPNGRKMNRNRRWRSSRVAPFASNIQFQLLTCSDDSSPTSSSATSSPTQIRLIVNDGVMSLTGIEGCPEQKDGMCPVETFIASQKKLLEATDWDWTCHGNWSVPEGDAWRTLTGDPPAKDE